MRARIIELGEVPDGLARAVLDLLPAPCEGGVVERAGPALARLAAGEGQLEALRLLEALPAPEPGWVVIGLTDRDLGLAPLAYVTGLAPVGRARGVVSWSRLWRGVASRAGAADPRLVHRLALEVAHELGHGLGLVHCPVPTCVMHPSVGPDELDLKDLECCPTCHAEARAAQARLGAGTGAGTDHRDG